MKTGRFGNNEQLGSRATSMAAKAKAYFKGGEITVVCPHCLAKSTFPDWGGMYTYICDKCGEAVEVEKTDSLIQ